MGVKENAQTGKEREERGPKTPGVPLGAALQLLRQVRDGVGFGRAGRETVVKALGYNSLNGRSNRVLAALIHFGLLERSGEAAVQISSLGKQVLLPRDDVETRKALLEAASRPTLYKKLFARFQGHGLPALLPNILVREFGVLPSSSEEVAKVFRDSMTDAGLLRNGVLHAELEAGGESVDESSASAGLTESAEGVEGAEEPSRVDSPTPRGGEAAAKPGGGIQRYTIPLDRMGRIASIDIPLPVGVGDLARIKAWADYMLAMETEN